MHDLDFLAVEFRVRILKYTNHVYGKELCKDYFFLEMVCTPLRLIHSKILHVFESDRDHKKHKVDRTFDRLFGSIFKQGV